MFYNMVSHLKISTVLVGILREKSYICNWFRQSAVRMPTSPDRVSGLCRTKPRKRHLAESSQFRNRQISRNNRRTLDEECPLLYIRIYQAHSLIQYRYGRGADFFKSCLLGCLAIPEIEGREADLPHVFCVSNTHPGRK